MSKRTLVRSLLLSALLATAATALGLFGSAPTDAQAAGDDAPSPVKVLAGGRLLDGFGGPPLENSVVVIEGATIAAVGARGRSRSPRAPSSSPPRA